MRTLLVLAALLAPAAIVYGADPDAEARAALALALAARHRHPAVATTTGHWTTRAPVGHTHTCVNGHTWDHAANPTHTCAVCGAQQFVIDQPSRPVTVWVAASAPQPAVPAQAAPFQAPATTYAPAGTYSNVYTLPASSGGCAGGNCPAGVQRAGPFGGRFR